MPPPSVVLSCLGRRVPLPAITTAAAALFAATTIFSACSADIQGSRPRPVELSTEFFLVPERTPPPPAPSLPSVIRTMMVNRTMHHPPSVVPPSAALLRNENWVVPLLALSLLTIALIAGFEIFVLCKAWRTSPSRRHLFLGQMLLFGLFLCATLAGILAATPTPATCAMVRLGTGVGYALVFAALLVKCVFLISLNGGVYLPAPYQALLLLFAVLIQVAVGVQWLLSTPPGIVVTATPEITTGAPPLLVSNSSPGRRLVLTASDVMSTTSSSTSVILCRTPYPDLLLSLVYVAGLIILVAILAVKSRGIRDNYREATFIGLAVGCAIPIWLVWALCGLVVPERHRDACLAFGLVATSMVVFLVMFMPKGRQLAAMGKEGVYLEDREDRFSSLTPPGSGYSPSFFHFKPVKYGIVPQPQGTTQPANISGPTKQSAAVNAATDRVALVAPPPSYTRMYQYYPYCQYPRHPPHPQLIAPCTRPSNVLPIYFDTKSGGVYLKPDDGNLYTTLEPTLSTNPNVYFQRSGVHPGMMY